MQHIADWLEKLGMSEYAERFAESDIDIDVLSELTDHDFDRLGVSLGHRRKMLRSEPFHQRRGQSRFPNAGFTGPKGHCRAPPSHGRS